eukprot:1179378-Prorocentrum_minimum.AAC.2
MDLPFVSYVPLTKLTISIVVHTSPAGTPRHQAGCVRAGKRHVRRQTPRNREDRVHRHPASQDPPPQESDGAIGGTEGGARLLLPVSIGRVSSSSRAPPSVPPISPSDFWGGGSWEAGCRCTRSP